MMEDEVIRTEIQRLFQWSQPRAWLTRDLYGLHVMFFSTEIPRRVDEARSWSGCGKFLCLPLQNEQVMALCGKLLPINGGPLLVVDGRCIEPPEEIDSYLSGLPERLHEKVRARNKGLLGAHAFARYLREAIADGRINPSDSCYEDGPQFGEMLEFFDKWKDCCYSLRVQ